MTLSLTQSVFAVGPNIPASFLATGGTAPFVYTVLPGGAGGTIDPSTGVYIAPSTVPTSAATQFDTVEVTDHVAATATAQIMVGDTLLLFCDVLQQGLGLANGRVWIWDQKIFQPTDNGLYVSVAEMEPKVVANNASTSADGASQVQYVVFKSKLEINLISRDSSARLRKSDFVMALNSTYSEQQQEINSFLIGKTPPMLTNISVADGAAILYRYTAWVNIQYSVGKTTGQQYFSSFSTTAVAVND